MECGIKWEKWGKENDSGGEEKCAYNQCWCSIFEKDIRKLEFLKPTPFFLFIFFFLHPAFKYDQDMHISFDVL